jgi:hypothetical protein
MSEPSYAEVLQTYLDLYANQPPRQAELVIPQWAMVQLNALPEAERVSILHNVDLVAQAHGLLTPTKVIVTTDSAHAPGP